VRSANALNMSVTTNDAADFLPVRENFIDAPPDSGSAGHIISAM
jgi:hypothetical protein